MGTKTKEVVRSHLKKFLAEHNEEWLFGYGGYIEGNSSESDCLVVRGKYHAEVTITIDSNLVNELMQEGFKEKLKKTLISTLNEFDYYTFSLTHSPEYFSKFPNVNKSDYFDELHHDEELFRELSAALLRGRHILL